MLELKLQIYGYTVWYYVTGFNKISNIADSEDLITINGFFKDVDGKRINKTIEINQWMVLSVMNETEYPICEHHLARDLAFDLP